MNTRTVEVIDLIKKKGGAFMRKLVKKIDKKKTLVSFYYCENTHNCNGK